MSRLYSNLDIPILMFLWKWKIASTRAIASRYYSQKSVEAAYKRLLFLRHREYIHSRLSIFGEKHVWQLTQKGFQLIKEMLPPLIQEGYKSEHVSHDILVAAAHLGDWIKGEPKGVRLYSEQELRRFPSESLPKWFPDQDELEKRRPDGYWAFDSVKGHRLVALEVELTQKSEGNYESISSFYNTTTKIDSVLWITKNANLIRVIQKAFEKSGSSRRHIHSYAKAEDFIRSGWGAPIISGANKGVSIFKFLNGVRQSSGNLQSNHSAIIEQSIACSPLLNLQKGHRKTKGSTIFKIGDSFV